jgi:hypothetical protein
VGGAPSVENSITYIYEAGQIAGKLNYFNKYYHIQTLEKGSTN